MGYIVNNGFEIYRDKAAAIGTFVICSAITAYCIYEIITGSPIKFTGKYKFVFGHSHNAFTFCAATMSLLALFGLKNTLSSKAAIQINHEGVWDRRSFKTPIPWAAIERFGHEFIELNKNDMEYFILEIKQNALVNTRFTLAYHLGKLLVSSPKPNIIPLNLNGLDVDIDEIKSAIQQYRTLTRPAHNTQSSRRIFS